ncbi:acyl carrier protein [Alkalilimnicola ehrlichii MLHE-1]|uniref:Phosphopantetheine-binding protein n=1 Tax=Alkalilimnicola ehrlichii (strain ATCC BAA-1101 / DSM 17681 / MLHE-1) TaxID=187272 RepID=Q0A5F3_ALKEH|nr:acyl carrier protein [Alkalilimnicola ehrlichii]ABI57934.1 phosphopantetheine-binding protein [Alkalilimnicola ehrlichii MLHE-1]
MKQEDLRRTILEELARIAPDVDVAAVDDQASLRDEYDLDSVDALNLLTALHKRLGVDIPEADYGRLHSLQDLLDYLGPRLG